MKNLLLPEIQALLSDNRLDVLKEFCEESHPADVADALEGLAPEQLSKVLSLVSPEIAAQIFGHIEDREQIKFADAVDAKTVASLVEEMDPDDSADLLRELDEKDAAEILRHVPREEREDVRLITSYPEDTAGAIMTTEFASLDENLTVAEALAFLRREAPDKETIYTIYVVDSMRRLKGVVSLKDLILTAPDRKVARIVQRDVISMRADAHQAEVADKMKDYDFLAMPIVDEADRLLGIVTFDDVMDVMEDEATEDMYYLASLNTDETVFTSPFRSFRLRIPWLILNLGTASVSAFTVSLFESSIAKYVALAVMMPVVAGLGGNAGTQSLTVTVRGIALGEVSIRGAWRSLLKGICAGLLLGATCGAIMGTLAGLWFHSFWFGLIVFAAMIVNLINASLFGALVPRLLRALKLDPALGSSIFVTAMTDVGGFLIFLGLATLFLHHLL
ncbi:MAG: magnesium transporter [Candidatus Coatesbacteria bacterium]|nr:magnesium transporter [Candidatus Coatesbacteria bacterium]